VRGTEARHGFDAIFSARRCQGSGGATQGKREGQDGEVNMFKCDQCNKVVDCLTFRGRRVGARRK